MTQRTALSIFLPLALVVSVTLGACQSQGVSMNATQTPNQTPSQNSSQSTAKSTNQDIAKLAGIWRLDLAQPHQWSFSEKTQDTLSLTFNAEGRAFAYAGCNRMSFQYELTEHQGIRPSVFAITKRACPDMKDERILAGFLSTLNRYQIQENTLTLFNAHGQSLRFITSP